MKILLSGATGLVGAAFFQKAHRKGALINRLVRSVGAQSGADVLWDPITGKTEPDYFEGYDAVVHLAGDSIAGCWTPAKKTRIRESRVVGTQNLSEILAKLKKPPKVFVVASAIGYYGSRGEAVLEETSGPGTGFLAETCQAWEAATQAASQKGIRVVNLRFGIVLSPNGGALKMMLCPFKMGLGGIVGDGKQYMSWVALDDVVSSIEAAIEHETFKGPLNATAPNPVTNQVFTDALGNALKRPTLLPMPALAARLAFGEMADALLLSSTRVSSKKIEGLGFKFLWPEIGPALKAMLFR